MSQGSVEIQGNVGAVLTAHAGSTVNVYVARPDAGDMEARSRLIHLLLRKTELAGIRRLIERISFRLYGSRYFKALTIEQMLTLHEIADEIIEVMARSRGHYALPAQRVSASDAV